MNNVCNICLRSALNFHRARIQLYAKILRPAEFALDFLYPVAAFAINPALLARASDASASTTVVTPANLIACFNECLLNYFVVCRSVVSRSVVSRP